MTKSKRPREERAHNNLENSLTQYVSQFEAKQNPSNKDLMAAIVTMMKYMVEINSTQVKIEKENQSLRSKVVVLSERADSYEKKSNAQDQKEVNSDLYLTNFPFKPNCDEVCVKLSALLEIPPEEIISSYSFEQTRNPRHQSSPSKAPVTFFSMVVKLKNEQTKINALTKKKMLGVIKLQQLINKKLQPTQELTSVPCLSRLTKFNNSVIKKLIPAKNEKKIEMFQLRNGLFRYKANANSAWCFIGTENDLLRIDQHGDDGSELESNGSDDDQLMTSTTTS